MTSSDRTGSGTPGGTTVAVQKSPDRRDVHGVLVFDKPIGLTSNQALQRLRRLYRARKAGHTGSLDPLASGMLPLCFGEATKFAGYLLDAQKTYRVRATFGVRTDTGDAEGECVETGPPEVSVLELERVLARFRGVILQTPPMYSALKHAGRRLYEWARAGQQVQRQPRPVEIAELVVEQPDPQQPVLRVRCSKGTYVRTLVEDIAAAAGTVGHVTELRRLAVGPFGTSTLVTAEVVERVAGHGLAALDALLLPVDRLLEHWPAVSVTRSEAGALRHGQAIAPASAWAPGFLRLYDPSGRLIGLGEMLPEGRLVPRRLMAGSVP